MSERMSHHSMWPYWIIIPAWIGAMVFCGYAVVMPSARAEAPIIQTLPDPPGGLYGANQDSLTQAQFDHDVFFALGQTFNIMSGRGIRFNPDDPNFVQWARERLFHLYQTEGKRVIPLE